MKLIPASSARWMILIDVSWSGSPHAPNIMEPRQSGLTCIPVRPRLRYSMPRRYAGRAGVARFLNSDCLLVTRCIDETELSACPAVSLTPDLAGLSPGRKPVLHYDPA